MTRLTLEQANTIIEAALAEGASQGLKPLTVSVLSPQRLKPFRSKLAPLPMNDRARVTRRSFVNVTALAPLKTTLLMIVSGKLDGTPVKVVVVGVQAPFAGSFSVPWIEMLTPDPVTPPACTSASPLCTGKCM